MYAIISYTDKFNEKEISCATVWYNIGGSADRPANKTSEKNNIWGTKNIRIKNIEDMVGTQNYDT